MHRLLIAALTSLSLTACATDDQLPSYDDDPEVAGDGKADSTFDAEWCKEVAGNYARQLYNDFEDVEILETTVAKITGQGSTWLWVQTDSEGHGRQSTDIILMAKECYPIGSKYSIEDRGAAVYFARKAAQATQAHVEKTWDFDRILSAEPRFPITSAGITVDVKVLDLGFDEGTFEVKLGTNGKVKSLVQTGSFTP